MYSKTILYSLKRDALKKVISPKQSPPPIKNTPQNIFYSPPTPVKVESVIIHFNHF